MDTKTEVCPYCGGDKTVCVQHPSWGSPTCPEAYIMVPCPECDGTGEVEKDEVEDLIANCVWRHAAMPFARNH